MRFLVIERYQHPLLWPLVMYEDTKFDKWLQVETVTARVQEGRKEIPSGVADALQKVADQGLDGDAIRDEEETTGHDMVAFLNVVRRQMESNGDGKFAPFVHFGLTSYDVEDTAEALVLRAAVGIISDDLEKLKQVLKRRAGEHWRDLCLARTHGMPAEVTTFGYKLSGWLAKVTDLIHELKHLEQVVAVGKISGVVGTHTLDPAVESGVCAMLNLVPARMSTQILDRRIHAQYASTLIIIAQEIACFAEEVRNLQRAEIGEVQEYFARGQVGSSAMKHKRNPRSSENVSGVGKLVRGMIEPFYANIITWHERDLSNSSPERMAIPLLTNWVGYAVLRMTGVIDKMLVDPERMKQNLIATKGVIYSQNLLLALRGKGMPAEEAEPLVQRLSFEAVDKGIPFNVVVARDPTVKKWLSARKRQACFDPWKSNLRYIDQKAALLGIQIPV